MKKTFVTVGITVLVMVVALFGTAYLALAQGENIINACVSKDGSLRVVISEEQCKSKETPLSWNVEGQQGPQGEPGPQGEQGEQGPMPGFYTVTSETVVPGSSVGFGASAFCDIHDVVTGGGYHYILYENGEKSEVGFNQNGAIANRPDKSDGGIEGWTVRVWSNAPASHILEVFAICADLTP